MGKIILRLDRVMADRKSSLKELSEKIGISNSEEADSVLIERYYFNIYRLTK